MLVHKNGKGSEHGGFVKNGSQVVYILILTKNKVDHFFTT